MRKEFRDLIGVREFGELIESFSLPGKKKSVSLDRALGDVTAENVYAPRRASF